MTLDEALVAVWRQTLVENAKAVELAGRRFIVKRTPRRGLRQVDFEFDGETLRGLEQNPETSSRWAQLARGGAKVMQFLELSGGRESTVADGSLPAKSREEPRDLRSMRYLAVVVNGKVTHYR